MVNKHGFSGCLKAVGFRPQKRKVFIMKYDFTSIMQRHGMDAVAVDPPADSVYCKDIEVKKGFEPIPMWVADMNYPACPTIIEAMKTRIEHPAYGYFLPRDEYYASIINWQEKRNQVKGLTQECIGYENGVLGGVVSALKVFCSRGDKVLVHAPMYIGFTAALDDNGYQVVLSYLKKDDRGIWRMDYEEMERLLQKEKIHAAIFCSPHNPTGRVWERWEIEKAMELYQKYDVFVISDEIWSDLILEGYRHIPTQSVSEDARKRTVALYAPSKTFNLAGLVGSYHIIYDNWIRDRVERESNLCHYNTMNMISMYALIGAYRKEGSDWVDELCKVLTKNADYACDFIQKNFEGVSVARPQGTYLIYLDCSKYLAGHEMKFDALFLKGIEYGIFWQDGRPFRMPDTIRMNLALPYARVEEAFERLKQYVFV